MTRPSDLQTLCNDMRVQTKARIEEYEQKIAELSPHSEEYPIVKEFYEDLIKSVQESMDGMEALARNSRIPRPSFQWKNVFMLVGLSMLASAVMIYVG